jgi:hypothetical protein
MITAFTGTMKRASDPAGLRIGSPEHSSGVSRHQNRLDEAVQPVQIDVGQARGQDCSHAIANFEFERSISRPARRSQP